MSEESKMGSEELSKLKDLEKSLKPLIEGNILDIIIFGSLVKGKHKPRDVDVAIIVKNEEEFGLEELSEIREDVKNFFENVDTEVVNPLDIYTTDLGLRIIIEGYSVRESEFLNETLHIRPFNIYEYSLEDLDRSEKTRFNRALKRLVNEIKGEKIGRCVVKVPRKNSGEVEDVFKRWDIWKSVKTREMFEY